MKSVGGRKGRLGRLECESSMFELSDPSSSDRSRLPHRSVGRPIWPLCPVATEPFPLLLIGETVAARHGQQRSDSARACDNRIVQVGGERGEVTL